MSEQLALFRDSLNRFLDQKVQPFYQQWEDEGIIPRSIWQDLGAAGFLCVDVESAYGGCDGDLELSALVVRILSERGFAALATNVSVHSDMLRLTLRT